MLIRPRLFAISIVALALSSTAFGQNHTSFTKSRGSDTNAKPANRKSVEEGITAALALIQQNYAAAGSLDYNNLFISSINTMLHTMDPHSNYLDPQASREFNAALTAEYFGIGAVLVQRHDEHGDLVTYVEAPYENSPAYRAGLKYGDELVEIDGVAMRGLSFDEVRAHLLGPRGTKVTIVIEHHATRARESYEITRDAIPQHSVPIAYFLSPGVGYILLTNFSQSTGDEFRRAMADLHRQGMEYLILDLRNNFGGLTSQAVQVATTFLMKGQMVFATVGRNGKNHKFTSDNKTPDQTPIVVLINQETASSGEILSGALQDNDRAFFIGHKTFGKGLTQKVYTVEKTSTLLLTMARYLTPSGRWIQRDYSDGNLYDYYHGVNPTIETASGLKGPVYKTATGRIVYGGGGIAPDVIWTAPEISPTRNAFREHLKGPIAAFSLNLADGGLVGFEGYRTAQPIAFSGSLRPTDFPISAALYTAFRQYAAEKWALSPARIDREREYVERLLRVELATAAYGTDQSLKIENQYDPEITKALELLPQAKQLAQSSFQLAPKK